METLHIQKIEAQRDAQGALLWRNAESKALYRRVVGGLAWPRGNRPGALVALVEHLHPQPGQDMRRVEVAAEFVDADPGQLLRKASHWAETLHCRALMTDLSAPEMQLAFDYNDGRARLRLPQLDLGMPPAMNGSRDFAAYHRLMERRTRSIKTLFYGERSMVAREYNSRQLQDFSRPVENFPVVAAFLWALGAIDLDAPTEAGVANLASRHRAADPVAGY